MEFCVFASTLKDILGAGMHAGPFTRVLFEKITIIPADVTPNPLVDHGDNTFKAYFTGDRKLSRFVPKISKYLEREQFVTYIHDLEAEQQNLIYESFHKERKTMTPSNIPEEMADLFMEILSQFIHSPKKKVPKAMKAQLQRVHDEPITHGDFVLLSECNMRCPLCHNRLLKTVKGQVASKDYVAIQIYPDNLDLLQQAEFLTVAPQPTEYESLDNKMLLCRNCADAYMIAPTVAEFRNLFDIKTQQTKDIALADLADSVDVENGVLEILDALASDKKRPKPDKKSSYDVWWVSDKIPDDNWDLQDKVTYWVLRYYRKIEEFFEEKERMRTLRFKKVKNEVSQMFETFDEQDKSQPEIFELMVAWLEEQTGCKNRRAREAFISFFVQNCEVFYEIAE